MSIHAEDSETTGEEKKPRTDAKYVKEGGGCPGCGSGESEGAGPAPSMPHGWHKAKCKSCGNIWMYRYEIIGCMGQHEDDHERTAQDKVTVEVTGGVAEITSCPGGVTVEIIDHDNAAVENQD